MPTANPRIQVTVKPSQYQLIRRLAKLQNRSMASVLAELFDQIEPVYERVAVVLQAAVRATDSVKEGFRSAAEEAEAELAPMLTQAMGQLDLLVADATARSDGAGKGAQRTAAPERPTPEPVTRGSGLPHEGVRTGAKRPIAKRSTPRKSLKKQAARRPAATQGRRR